jgi:asparagine synthetase B (glutamine-hydrolysing)
MHQAALFEMERRGGGEGSASGEPPGLFQLVSNAWIGPRLKASVLRSEVWRALEHDAALCSAYTDDFDTVERGCGAAADPLEAHLRFHRRVNLVGLLGRLDTATMLEGVEGRTPLADVVVAELAEGLPMRAKFAMGDDGEGRGSGRSGGGRDRTKIALRAAYRGSAVPAYVLERPKASFPVPFQQWMRSLAPVVRESAFVRELFTPEAIDIVAENPEAAFQLAWPMINVALWARRWWG